MNTLFTICSLVSIFLLVLSIFIYKRYQEYIKALCYTIRITPCKIIHKEPFETYTDIDVTEVKFCSDVIMKLENITIHREKNITFNHDGSTLNSFMFIKNSIFGIIFLYNNKLWIIFRGTFTSKEWSYNLDFKFTDMNIKDTYLQCHSGFHRLYTEYFRDQIYEVINTNDISEVVFSGHSLGAGVATLASIDIKTTFPDKSINAYLFGSPRVLGYEISKLINMPKIWRVNNTSDIITQLPFATTSNSINLNNRIYTNTLDNLWI